jgi:predicted protein tyrosine phosphatase
MQQNGITYILNVSTTSPKPAFIQEGHFLRIPVNDSYCDKLLPFFQDAFQFLDKVRESNSCALVHCLAGISRSPTLAIAYIMRYLGMTTDEAYKYVKDKRPTISPNFNFLGQLLEYEQLLNGTKTTADVTVTAHHVKRPCTVDLMSPVSPTTQHFSPTTCSSRMSSRLLSLHSPTTALALLNFTQPSPVTEESTPVITPSDTEDGNSLEFHKSTAFTQLPISSIGQINFKPCFACVDAFQPLIQHGSCVKRLLTDNNVRCTDNVPAKSSNDCVVTFRTQSKRSLTRPNSITFSSLSAVVDGFEQANDTRKLGTELMGSVLTDRAARKSRSLEDILNSPVENVADGAGREPNSVQGRSVVGRLPSAVDILGPSLYTDVTDSSRCWPVAGSNTAHKRETPGSISSGSLHGSVEVIEVS